jgi:preprotein translocase SecF subunit
MSEDHHQQADQGSSEQRDPSVAGLSLLLVNWRALFAVFVFLLPIGVVLYLYGWREVPFRVDVSVSGGVRVTYGVRPDWWKNLPPDQQQSLDLSKAANQLQRLIADLADDGLVNYADAEVSVIHRNGSAPGLQVLVPTRSNVQRVLDDLGAPKKVTFHLIQRVRIDRDAEHTVPYVCGYFLPSDKASPEALAQAIGSDLYALRLLRLASSLAENHNEFVRQRNEIRVRVAQGEPIPGYIPPLVEEAVREALEETDDRLKAVKDRIRARDWDPRKDRPARNEVDRVVVENERTVPEQRPVVLWLKISEPYLQQENFDLDRIRVAPDDEAGHSYRLVLPAHRKSAKAYHRFFADGYGRHAVVLVDGRAEAMPAITSGRFQKLDNLQVELQRLSGSAREANEASWTVGDQERANLYRKFLRSERLDVPLDVIELTAVDALVDPDQKERLKHATLLSIIAVLILMNLIYGRYPFFYLLYILNIVFVVGAYLLCVQLTLLTFNIAMIGATVLAIGMSVDPLILLFDDVVTELRDEHSVERTRTLLWEAFCSERRIVFMASLTTCAALIWLLVFGGDLRQFAIAVGIGCALNLVSLGLAYLFLSAPGVVHGVARLRLPTFEFLGLFRWVGILHRPLPRCLYLAAGGLTLLGCVIAYVQFDRGKPGLWLSGGTSLVIQSAEPVSANVVRDAVDDYFGESCIVRRLGHTGHRYLIETTSVVAGPDEARSRSFEVQELLQQVSQWATTDFTLESIASLSPVRAASLGWWATAAILACTGFLIAVLVYRYSLAIRGIWIWIVLALASDVLVALLVAQILEPRMSPALLAGVAAVAGYSVNDSVVICERMRELAAQKPVPGYTPLVDRMVPRVVATSLTTILPLLVLCYLLDGVLAQLGAVLAIGIATGTLSSVALVAGNFRQSDQEVANRVQRYLCDRCQQLRTEVDTFREAPSPEGMSSLVEAARPLLQEYERTYQELYKEGTDKDLPANQIENIPNRSELAAKYNEAISPEFLTTHFSRVAVANASVYQELLATCRDRPGEQDQVIALFGQLWNDVDQSLAATLAGFERTPTANRAVPDDLAEAYKGVVNHMNEACQAFVNTTTQALREDLSNAGQVYQNLGALEHSFQRLSRASRVASEPPSGLASAREHFLSTLADALGRHCYGRQAAYQELLHLCHSGAATQEVARTLRSLRDQVSVCVEDQLRRLDLPVQVSPTIPPQLEQALDHFALTVGQNLFDPYRNEASDLENQLNRYQLSLSSLHNPLATLPPTFAGYLAPLIHQRDQYVREASQLIQRWTHRAEEELSSLRPELRTSVEMILERIEPLRNLQALLQ